MPSFRAGPRAKVDVVTRNSIGSCSPRLFARSLPVLLATLPLLACGCGSDGSDGDGTVVPPWTDFCVATFTQDTTVLDVFGDAAFTARAGSEYLLTDWSDFSGEPLAEIAYLTDLGPDTYKVAPVDGRDEFPFTSNCTDGSTVDYYAAFTDAVFFDSEELSSEICRISTGTYLRLDPTRNAGAAATSFTLDGPQTYEVALNAFSDQCGGAETGYVRVPQTVVLGVHTWLLPITVIMGPAPAP